MVSRFYRSQATRRLKARPLKQMKVRRHTNDLHNELERDLAAMKKVWKMLREGSVRWLGEIGRQY